MQTSRWLKIIQSFFTKFLKYYSLNVTYHTVNLLTYAINNLTDMGYVNSE